MRDSIDILSIKVYSDIADPEDTSRLVIPHDEELKYLIPVEANDTTMGGHVGY